MASLFRCFLWLTKKTYLQCAKYSTCIIHTNVTDVKLANVT